MYDLLVYWLITVDEEIACLLQSALLFPKLRDHFPCLIMLCFLSLLLLILLLLI